MKSIKIAELVNTHLDVEFSDDPKFYYPNVKIGKLFMMNPDIHTDTTKPYSDGWSFYSYCRPRLNHWYFWHGGPCPLPAGFVISARLRGGNVETIFSLEGAWRHEYTSDDIVGFMISGKQAGYVWPWEKGYDKTMGHGHT